jgi:hypothetical protein
VSDDADQMFEPFDELVERRKDFPACDGSPTRLKRHEGCALSHRIRYVDKVPDPAGPDGRVGTLVHAAVEDSARKRLNVEAPPPAEAVELVEHLAAHVPEVEGATLEDVARAKEILEGVAPLDLAAGGMILGVEAAWTLDVGPAPAGATTVVPGRVTFGGFWDLVRRRTDGTLEVVDWKTGRAAIGVDELEVDAQASLYLAAARAWVLKATQGQDDGREILCTFAFLAVGSKITARWSPELDVFARSRARAAHAAWSRGHDRARITPACARCFARERCKPYQEHVAKLEVVGDPPELRHMPLPELLRQRARLKQIADLADGRRVDLDRELLERMDRSGQKSFELGDWKPIVTERRSGSYDVSVVPELAAEAGKDPYEVLRTVCRVSADGVKKFVKGNEQLERLAERYRDPTKTRFVQVRAAKGKV